ncbi:nucleoside triphosphate pyrophosphohydrolase [Cyclobacterium sp. 1_MG-2023]|uniref:nucleoside triphosphate pyrophosphohydrolase n=1 Tax=Cyclobacterium sp. 1_MG-2023 TaxID=3062681 RepID=UPI0026E47454|nr:nucleoside triphosphate pyrophosphohydrolase [Cyclobacterium sp. 1_MG-2023]MDO6437685.1 nucleoside triphosphate pyrophosphohydrolase [Cyclobacterium sp. 1_MG-2023]
MNNPEKRKEQLAAFDKLLTIMDELREKCPWDRKQTIESLRHLTIEETFELSDAILNNDLEEISKELGDILLHIVFYARLGDEKNAFDIGKVIEQLNEKLIRRHPHIYGDTAADDEEAVKQNWEKIKLKEKGNTSVLGGVPRSLPALIKAMRIQEKARGVGFDWEEKQQVWGKVEEEMAEFRENFDATDEVPVNKEEATKEFGDLLFSLINYSRFIGVNPEEALEKTNKKFIYRFQYLESAAKASGKTLAEMSLQEMNAYWEAAKKKE